MKIAIYGNEFDSKYIPYVQKLFDKLSNTRTSFVVFSSFMDFLGGKITFENNEVPTYTDYKDLVEHVDFLFSIGGDGTFLESTRFVRNTGIPILGINTGRLGFLSSVTKDDLEQLIDSLINGQYTLEMRSLLQLCMDNNPFENNNFALNEVSITRQDTTSMITIHSYINGEFLNSYWADGLVISTATGSTAYSLSCGGPIVMPGTEVFVITPVAPHNLNVRPIVVPDDCELTLIAETRSPQILVALDARPKSIQPSTELIIKKNQFKINLVRLTNQSYLGTLRTKLNWGLDKRN